MKITKKQLHDLAVSLDAYDITSTPYYDPSHFIFKEKEIAFSAGVNGVTGYLFKGFDITTDHEFFVIYRRCSNLFRYM